MNELRQLEARIPSWSRPIRRRSACPARPRPSSREVQHAIPMLSLANGFTEEDLADFDRKVRERLGSDGPIDYSATPKLDGLAISLLYRDGVSRARPRAATASPAKTSPRTSATIRSRAAAAARQAAGGAGSARRGVPAVRGLREDEPRRRGARRQDLREPAQRRVGQPAPARSAHHRATAAGSLFLRARRGGGRRDSRTPQRARALAQRAGAAHRPRGQEGPRRRRLPRLLPRHRRAPRQAAVPDRRRGLQGR